MRITVTQNLIDTNMHNCETCPVALAIGAHTNHGVIVCSHAICIGGENDIKTSREVRNWIEKYDSHEDVKPFTFNLSAENFIIA